jgi:predicted HD phosphohydrolase
MTEAGKLTILREIGNGDAAMAFTSLTTATAADWQKVMSEERAIPHARHVRELLLLLLKQQRDDDCFGVPVNGYQHCLQTTTRVLEAGESEELIVCSLFHDVGEKMAPFSHGAVIADILQPFISERNEWMLRHHPVFQQYHFLEHPGIDRHAREAFRGSPHFDYTARYCEIYDQNSFDPDFPTLPLEHFEPIVEAFFSRFDGIESLRLPA